MKVVAILSLISGAWGHGSMTIPRPRNNGDQSVHPSPGADLSCKGDACYWYQVGCYIGCSECSGTGKDLYPKPYCSNPIKPTNNDPNTRSWDPHTQSRQGDFTKYNPWRAPGKAPVDDPCGVASGYHNPSAYADIPKGYRAYDKGSKVLPEQAPTYWKAGGTAEVGWAMSAQHGGGYSYRLCPKGEELTEACFQANHLSFSSKNTTVRYHDGSRKDFQIPTTNLISEGKHWRRNPNPGCACDIGEGCTQNGVAAAAGATEHSHVEGFVDRKLYAKHGPATPLCPLGTMFDAGWEPISMGFLTGQASPFSVVDEVEVPSKKGQYVLSWRWDCEETDQVWNSCADIVITDSVPPTPAPTPAPPSPPPSPAQDKYVCYLGKCYSKGSYGTMTKEECDSTCAAPGPSPGPSPSKGDYLCYQPKGQCYEKPGYGKLDKETCESTCKKTFLDGVVV